MRFHMPRRRKEDETPYDPVSVPPQRSLIKNEEEKATTTATTTTTIKTKKLINLSRPGGTSAIKDVDVSCSARHTTCLYLPIYPSIYVWCNDCMMEKNLGIAQ
jgi:hypothetical protein